MEKLVDWRVKRNIEFVRGLEIILSYEPNAYLYVKGEYVCCGSIDPTHMSAEDEASMHINLHWDWNTYGFWAYLLDER